MIKVITGFKVKRGADIQPILLKLRSHAIQYPGFIGAETLISRGNSSVITSLSTWQNTESWRLWERSKIRQELLREAERLLEEEPKVTLYMVAPTTKWG